MVEMIEIVISIMVIVLPLVIPWWASKVNEWRNHPILKIVTDDFYPSETSGIKLSETYFDSFDKGGPRTERSVSEDPVSCFYYPLILRNDGKTMAKNVSVKIEVREESGKDFDRISPLKLEYRGFEPIHIPSNSPETFDFCYIDNSRDENIYFASLTGSMSRKRQYFKPFKLGTYFVNVHIFADNFQQKSPYRFKVIRKKGHTPESVEIELMAWP